MTVFIIIGLYFVGLLLIGYMSSKKNKSAEDFFVSGRSLNKWTAANTMAATAIGSGTTIGVCTMAYENGIAASWILIGYSLGFVLIALLIGKKIYRLDALTLTDVIGSHYNGTVKNLTTLLVLISYVGIACAQFIALGNIMSVLLGIGLRLCRGRERISLPARVGKHGTIHGRNPAPGRFLRPRGDLPPP